ncbi:beta-ketoacyl synthase N-terminal-like domain-containing protein [Actinophytocola gossypii]|uniref:Polyketide synthase dehydratase domain-containing protein n=1 Tax=Actinophytocola gossypii TaxID=2812003 RepID=A0ABT2J357_9PSEU|nr:beta-ketoacyl synthase N-terminal-like domain-containing protein [Actinophytocola gossypii]MCT2582276.1 polyketide synthase dehydratase domain-containing protein [Actinophytocola gossypii]
MTGYLDTDHEIRTLKALLRKSLNTIRELNQSATNAGPAEPIAVIGMACELPGGATTPEKYWSLLRSGRECTRNAPASEWVADVYDRYFSQNPRAVRNTRANYLDSDVMLFDPRAFNISPKEARDMDPTQRLALKLTAQALERAGYQPRRIHGRVGVYFGLVGGEYGALARQSAEPGTYVATGSLNSVVAGRISHTFDFGGPAVAVDTACSSSLVALHLATESIRAGDCDVAVVGGVNLLLDPSIFTVLSGFGALSADGRCRPFAADGAGYGRGEGGGVVVLKRWSDAVRDRDNVLALVHATSVNHDGTCSGLTVPNGRAQRALIERTLQRSGLRATDVDYLEAHGTGTRLGDPIELSAASAVYCQNRSSDRPLIVGSAKAQIGHLEAASGIASLIKLVLVLQNRCVPAQVVAGEPNRDIDFERMCLRPTAAEAPLTSSRPVGAVSSFGFSGTNGHAILSAAPPAETVRAGRRLKAQPVLLSARSATALTDQLRRLADHLTEVESDLEDVGFTLAVGRDHGPFRTSLLAETREQAVRTLEARLATPHLVTSSRLFRAGAAKLGFVLGAADRGWQARRWYGLFSAFRDGFDRVDAAWSELGGSPLTRWIESDTHPSSAVESAALQLGLLCGTVRLWRAFAIQPAIWMAEGIGCFAVAVETTARTAHDALAELSQLVQGEQVRPDGSIDLSGLPAPTIGRASTHGRHLDAAVICPRDGDFVGPHHLADPAYWAAAATVRADIAAAGRLCVEHDVRIGVLVGEGGTTARVRQVLEPVLTLVDTDEDVDDPRQALIQCLLRLYELGFDIDWRPLYENTAARRTTVPTSSLDEAVYAFVSAAERPVDVSTADRSDALQPAPHLSPGDKLEVDFELDPAELALSDTHHVVHIGYFVEMLLRGVTTVAPGHEFEVADMRFSAALVLRDAPGIVRLVFDGLGSSGASFAFHSLADAATNQWQQHVHGTLRERPPVAESVRARPPGAEHLCSGDEFYARLGERGMHLGPSVRAVGDVFRTSSGVRATVAAEHRAAPARASARVAPGLLDACAQLFHAALPPGEPSTAAFMVERLQGLIVHSGAPAAVAELQVENVRVEPDGALAHGRVSVHDVDGRTVLRCATATVRVLDRGIEQVLAAAGPVGDALRLTSDDLAAAGAGDRTAVEGIVRRMVARLTDAPEDGIGPGDSTAALGIDSLQATALHRALRPIDPDGLVPLADIVAGSSISDLAARLLGRRNGVAVRDVPATATSVERAGGYLKRRVAAARVRLLCVPYGGGSTLVFQRWQTLLGPDVDVCPVALPGRGERLGEPLVPDVYDVVDSLEPEAAEACDEPVVIYGHSAGALIGYLLALRLRRRGITTIRHLVVGAFSSPGVTENPFYRKSLRALAAVGYPGLPSTAQIRALDTDALRELARLLSLPAPPDVDAEFLRLTLPILVNDLRLVGSYRPAEADVLDIPVTAVHGAQDDRVAGDEMRDWRHRTSAGFDFHTVAGDHLFLHGDQREHELLDIIREVLK